MFCSKCGLELDDNSIYCPVCGIKIDRLKEEPKQASEQTISDEPTKETLFNGQTKPAESHKETHFVEVYDDYDERAIVSFVLGILSIICLIIPFVDFALAVVGLILNRKSGKKLNPKYRKAGFVFCVLGIIFSGIYILLLIFRVISPFSHLFDIVFNF